jgi:hypothetical protein
MSKPKATHPQKPLADTRVLKNLKKRRLVEAAGVEPASKRNFKNLPGTGRYGK